MITNKDIRVENGFLIINGDKYPLDGQSPEAIMQIVEDNSDTTPTENSTAPVQSGGVYSEIAGLNDAITDVLDKLDSKNYKVLSQDFTGVDISTSWGGWYVTGVLSINYSDLGLTNPPTAVLLSVKSETTTFLIMQIGSTAAKTDFYLVRPNSSTGVDLTIDALVIY